MISSALFQARLHTEHGTSQSAHLCEPFHYNTALQMHIDRQMIDEQIGKQEEREGERERGMSKFCFSEET